MMEVALILSGWALLGAIGVWRTYFGLKRFIFLTTGNVDEGALVLYLKCGLILSLLGLFYLVYTETKQDFKNCWIW